MPYLLFVSLIAGTHDLSLAYHTLDILATIQDSSQEIALPRYDKSLQNGRGDRAPVDVWPIIKGPIDIVLLEGWMLGFTSSNQPTTTDNPNLEVMPLHCLLC